MSACDWGHHGCARALIAAGAAVDVVDDHVLTALKLACISGHHECARALIEAGAAVDKVCNRGKTALMYACFWGHHECARALIDAQADLELTNRDGQNALIVACESPPWYSSQSPCRGRIRCALALLEATAPIRAADFQDRAALLQFACGRLQLIEVVLAMKHAIENAPPLANVGALKTDAQGIVANFARDMLATAKLPKPRRWSPRLDVKASSAE